MPRVALVTVGLRARNLATKFIKSMCILWSIKN